MTGTREDARDRPPVPSFSVVLPCFNAESTIAEVLEALIAMQPPAEDVIVVDDFSRDASLEICRRFPVTLIEQDEHRGVAVTRNRGAKFAAGDVLLFVDSDIVVPPDLIRSLINAHRDQPEFVGFSVLPDPDFHRGGFFSDYLNRRLHNGFSNLRDGVTTLCTSCATVEKGAFERVAGFDRAGTHAVNDEVSLGWRMADCGIQTSVLEGVFVLHLKRMSLGTWCRKFLHEGRQWVMLVSRYRGHHGPSAKLALQFRRPFNVVLMAAAVLTTAMAPWLGSTAFVIVAVLTACFLLSNIGYLRWMARGRGPVWVVAACCMLVLEAALHLVGLITGAIARVLPA